MKETSLTKRRLSYLTLAALLFALFLGVRASAQTTNACPNDHCLFLPVIRNRSPFTPLAPNLTIEEVTENATYLLDWSEGAEEATLFYELQGSSNPSFATRELIQVNDTEYVLNFSNGIRYYRVRGVGEGGFGPWSNVVSVNSSSFTANKTIVNKSIDECATLSWNYTGIKAFKVSLGHGYDIQAANGVDSVEVCPSIKTTYVAEVTNTDDTVNRFEVTIDVTGDGCNIDPYIEKFETTNSNPSAGEKFTISWKVECASAVFYKAGNFVAERPVTGNESNEESTPEDAAYVLRVQAKNGDTVLAEGFATIIIDVK